MKKLKQLLQLKLAGFILLSLTALVRGQGKEASANPALDKGLLPYTAVSGVSGNLTSIGSDTLNNLMTLWVEGFKKQYPGVNVQVEGKGSATAPPALIEGTAQLAPMSREMKKEEIDAFEKRFGYEPLPVKVAIDALAIFVHKDNPVKGLTLQQADSIFSSTFKAGGRDIATWDAVGVQAWKGRPLSLYGRNSASGTYGYFKEHALKKGDFKSTVKEQPGSSTVVQGVSADRHAIGYSGIGYATSGVRAVPLAEKAGAKYIEATHANCLDGSYPLARFLFIYVNKKPGAPLDKLTLEFMKFVVSKQGQEIVVKDGYFPLTEDIAGADLAVLTK